MNRNIRTQALILSSRGTGETDRIISFLTPERGVMQALLYGGRKSRYRSLVSPWHTGNIWLYTGSGRKTSKITDFDPVSYRAGLRENLYKNWAACLCTELVMRTEAAGEYGRCWTLVNGFLDGLDLCSPRSAESGLLRFLWRYLDLLGMQPNILTCVRCAAEIGVLPPDGKAQREPAYYNPHEDGLLCSHCISEHDTAIALSPDTKYYLEAAAYWQPEATRRIPVTAAMTGEMRQLLFFLVQAAAGGRLRCLDMPPYSDPALQA